MGILGWIVLGLVIGALAKAIMPGGDKGGIFVTMILGIVGAIVGGFVGKLVFGTSLGSFWNLKTWVLALIGALIVLAIYRAVAGRKA